MRAEAIKRALRGDVAEELGHATKLAERIKQLRGRVPGSLELRFDQESLRPPEDSTDLKSIVVGVIDSETEAIEHYSKIIEHCEKDSDPVTADLATQLLAEEEEHRSLFLGFLAELEGDIADIREEEQVNVSFCCPSSKRYASLSGVATTMRDQRKVESLWRDELSEWFPDGVEQSSLMVLKVTVVRAQYWDRHRKPMGQLIDSVKSWAVRAAASIVKQKDQIETIHVLQPPTYFAYGFAWGVPVSESDRIQGIQSFFDDYVEQNGIGEMKRTIRTGDPGTEIARFADEIDAGLIVIPSHGYHGFKHLVLGSVTERVLQLTECPVLVLRRSDAD
eukprot:g12604.t1